MIELEFLGPAGDGKGLVFTDADGERYRVVASPELRAEVGRALIRTVSDTDSKPTASPSQIQMLLRQGLSPSEVAEETGSEVDRVLRYSTPVEAEIGRAVQLAMAARVGPELDSPVMGDLVIDRLAARGIDPETVQWSASREPYSDWVTCLRFPEGGEIKVARWSNPDGKGRVIALDSVAQELTETVEMPSPIQSLFPPAPLYKREPQTSTPPNGAPDDDRVRQEELVDKLNRVRGKRVAIIDDLVDDEEAPDFDDEDSIEGFGDDSSETPGGGVVLHSVPGEAQLEIEFEEPPADTAPQPGATKKGKRTPVPSWDEIIFGQKSE